MSATTRTISYHSYRRRRHRMVRGVAAAISLAAAAAFLTWAATARSAELVPSIGVTRAVDGDENTKTFLGLALRGTLVPQIVQTEIGVGYHRDEQYGGDLNVKMIPVTASLLVSPVRSLHLDGGVGWYHTNLDYENPLLEDQTNQDFGIHVGGGMQVPLSPRAALDLTGRYVMLESQETRLIPEQFDPDFWTMSLGVAFRL